tara:strand:+ start:100 stop:294 length:195 start_codon:yes stop_codon:yes gene_type:complete
MTNITLYKGRKYSICSCGLSKTLPFCDNEHRPYNEKNGTDYKSIKIIAEETTVVNLNSSKWQKS